MKTLLLLAALGAAAAAHALDIPNYPPTGVFEGSDRRFTRTLTIHEDYTFSLEVTMKGKSGNHLRNGSGAGALTFVPGGWAYHEEGCHMEMARAGENLKLRVAGCAIAWGDVMFDGVYKPKARR
ncbi:hypothetical protein [Leeia aquatica]|uniref:Uncharacterized protein n=1 Tax=Leeia aquatica TaxID=2725557 RepID=A0A847RWG9_9NEIS|nr:hypothetical protein [Leeia aquatica]NLR74151.1 hypothetical protein [Leeia aquatica]